MDLKALAKSRLSRDKPWDKGWDKGPKSCPTGLHTVGQEKPGLLPGFGDVERAAIMEVDGGLWRDEAERVAALPDVPQEWIEGVEALQQMPALPKWTDQEWRQLQTDATAFLATWGAQALGLGWTLLDLFGVHAQAPRERYDAMGMVLMLGGRSVIAMDERVARIGIHNGVTHSFTRRQNVAGAVLIWDLGKEQQP